MINETEGVEFKGLTSGEVLKLQKLYGKNELLTHDNSGFLKSFFRIITQPMFLLLIACATVYFFLGESQDAIIMLISVGGIISIDVIQEWKTDKTLKALKDLSAPQIKVIRDSKLQKILSSDLVPGDIMLVSEGVKIPADGEVIKTNGLLIDESSLTGESVGVWKVTNDKFKDSKDYWRKDFCYAGTLALQGIGYVRVVKIGHNTEYGKIGKNVSEAPENPTPLQNQVNSLIKVCALIAALLFVLVGIVTFINLSDHEFLKRITASILSGITIAMALIPEEFPVILTVFLSMGAWRLARKQSLIRKLSSVETLGSVTVLCVDKTGTITLNKMTVHDTWELNTTKYGLNEVMGLACEKDAYDPMEKAMLEYCKNHDLPKEILFKNKLLSEYTFSNELKMMGKVWLKDDQILVAIKGSPEKVTMISNLNEEEKKKVNEKIVGMSEKGLRVIAVGNMIISDVKDIPKEITDCKLELSGLVGLADPPRESIKEDLETCERAGIKVVMITGDNGITASSIARKVGLPNSDKTISGEEIDNMNDEELRKRVNEIGIFSRVIPEHKMRIVKAFKANGEIVAMTGDGVNDAPALKYADIGIAMGKRGSEVSREAADLILMDDNFSTIVKTIKDGRRIYDNIKKSVGYIFTIHIPIAIAALLAPILNIGLEQLLLLPIHIVLLELIIDPTCSIVLEREPAEKDIMNRKPRSTIKQLLSINVLVKSILQGLVISVNSFGAYYLILQNNPNNPGLARSIGLTILILSSLFLVYVNSSKTDFVFVTAKKLFKDSIMLIASLGTIFMLLIILYSPLSVFLKLSPLTFEQLILSIVIAGLSVFWYEAVKLVQYINRKRNT